MRALNPVARLCLGWLLMLAGAWLVLEAGMPLADGKPRTATAGPQALAGLAAIGVGTVMRRRAIRPPE